MNTFTLSIALVTRNRPDSLARTLQSLSDQEFSPFEIIISDDSNKLSFINANKRLAKKFGCKYFSGPQKGLYSNRNFVIQKCTGTHLRTMDDDHTFPAGHMEKCLKAIEAEPNTIWTIGEYFAYEEKRPVPCRIPGQLHPRGFSVAPSTMEEYFGISCGGSIYPSRIIDQGLLNCELYKFGIVYLEYGARLKKLGFTIKFLPTTYIIHHDNQSTASELAIKEIEETKLFVMFCLSFKYQPSFYNIMNTLGQTLLGLVRSNYSIATIYLALVKFKNYSPSSSFAKVNLEFNQP